MTEIPMTEQDKADLRRLGLDPDSDPTKRSLLAIWLELLSNVENVKSQPIPIVVASKVVASWPFLSFQDTALYHARYHSILLDGRDLLRALVQDHPGCTEFVGERDAEENHEIYRDLLVGWHIMLDQLETEWDATDEQSHIDVAAIADARAFFFAQTGLAGHLDAIGFKLTDDEFFLAVRAAQEVQGE